MGGMAGRSEWLSLSGQMKCDVDNSALLCIIDVECIFYNVVHTAMKCTC